MNSTHLARVLRRNMTDAERKLWQALRRRNLGCKFRRQVALGPYVVDFVSYERRLVVELDGAQHLDSREDRARDSWLRQEGFKVLRFWNKDVLQNVEGVAARILEEVAPPPQPSPAQGGGG